MIKTLIERDSIDNMEYWNGKAFLLHLQLQIPNERSQDALMNAARHYRYVIYLPDNHIIHWARKLENFLIEKDGRTKITDFWLRARRDWRVIQKITVSGTTNYLSAEILLFTSFCYSGEVNILVIGDDGRTWRAVFWNIKNHTYIRSEKIVK